MDGKRWYRYLVALFIVVLGSTAAVEAALDSGPGPDGDEGQGYYCENRDAFHPVAVSLAARHDVEPALIMNWFCSGFGMGEIKLALQTAKQSGVNGAALLARRGAGEGWGQIWHSLGLLDTGLDDAVDGATVVTYYCTYPDAAHPIAESLAAEYGSSRGEIIDAYCGGKEFDEIAMALHTGHEATTPAPILLERRADGDSWLRVWTDNGLVVVPVPGEDDDAVLQGGEFDDVDGYSWTRGHYCRDREDEHPVGGRIARTYSVDYSTVMGWFCSGSGFGQIMLALQTERLGSDDADKLLERRRNGEGWGQIWQAQGLIGRPEDAGPPPHARNGRPEDRGRPDEKGPPPGQAGERGNSGNKGNNGNRGQGNNGKGK